jgi:hypothetical protein
MVGKKEKRMTYHHRQRPPAYILLKTEPGDNTSLDGEINKKGGPTYS